MLTASKECFELILLAFDACHQFILPHAIIVQDICGNTRVVNLVEFVYSTFRGIVL